MKIAFVANTLGSGGAERTISYLADSFIKYGNEVHIVLTSNVIFYSLNEQVVLHCLNMKSEVEKNIFKRAVRKFIRLVRQRKALHEICPDVVLCMPLINAELICKSKKIIGYKLFVSERSNPEKVGHRTIKKSLNILRYVDGAIFQTNRAKAFYPEYVQKKSIVIENAIGNPYVYKCKPTSIRENKIVAMGRLHDDKDYETLVTAFTLFHKTHENFELEIFGEGPEKEKIKNQIATLGMTDKIKLMGSHEDAIIKAADASCYVLSSKHEGMPNALMEAMAVGLPCVSTDCPNGPAELIENGVNGLLVPVGEPEAMAEAISRMINDKDFAEKCGANAIKIRKTHSVESVAKKYLDFFSGESVWEG